MEKKNITMENYDIKSPYERTIVLNNKLKLTPKAPRYSVVGKNFYGVFDDYCKALTYSKGLECDIKKQEKSNTNEAIQQCYNMFWRANGGRYIMKPIERGNELVFMERAKLFSRV